MAAPWHITHALEHPKFIRQAVPRGGDEKGAGGWDFYLITPDGYRLRSGKDVERWVAGTKDELAKPNPSLYTALKEEYCDAALCIFSKGQPGEGSKAKPRTWLPDNVTGRGRKAPAADGGEAAAAGASPAAKKRKATAAAAGSSAASSEDGAAAAAPKKQKKAADASSSSSTAAATEGGVKKGGKGGKGGKAAAAGSSSSAAAAAADADAAGAADDAAAADPYFDAWLARAKEEGVLPTQDDIAAARSRLIPEKPTVVPVKAGTPGAVVKIFQKGLHLGDVRVTHFIGSNLLDESPDEVRIYQRTPWDAIEKHGTAAWKARMAGDVSEPPTLMSLMLCACEPVVGSGPTGNGADAITAFMAMFLEKDRVGFVQTADERSPELLAHLAETGGDDVPKHNARAYLIPRCAKAEATLAPIFESAAANSKASGGKAGAAPSASVSPFPPTSSVYLMLTLVDLLGKMTLRSHPPPPPAPASSPAAAAAGGSSAAAAALDRTVVLASPPAAGAAPTESPGGGDPVGDPAAPASPPQPPVAGGTGGEGAV